MSLSTNNPTVLDTFVRGNAATLGPNYNADISGGGYSSFRILANQCAFATGGFASNYWNQSPFSVPDEVWATVGVAGTGVYGAIELGIINAGTAAWSSYELAQDGTFLYLRRIDSGTPTQLGATISATTQANEGYGLSRSPAGLLTVYQKPAAGAWAPVATRTDTTYMAPGFIGLWDQNDTTQTYSAFGGGSSLPAPPSVLLPASVSPAFGR